MTNKPQFTGERVPLTNLCSPKQWKTIPKSSLEDSGYPVYGANGIIGHYHDFNHAEETILIGCRGTCGQINVCPPQSYVTGNAMALDSLSDRVSLNYLEAFLRTYDFDKVIGGTSQPQITKQGLAKIMVPVPSLEEQVMIESKLQSVNSIKEAATHQLSLFDDLVKSRFVEMFGNPVDDKLWPHVTLAELCTKLGSGSTPRGGRSTYKTEGIPLIRSMNVHNGCFVWKDLTYIDDDQAAKLNGVTLMKGDVLLNITGASVARSCILPDELAGGRVNQHVSIVRIDQTKMLPIILNMALINDSYQRFLLNGSRMAGATREAITKEDLKSMKVPLPPLSLQQQFANFAVQVDKSRFVAQQQIEKLQMLYDSLAQEYFGD